MLELTTTSTTGHRRGRRVGRSVAIVLAASLVVGLGPAGLGQASARPIGSPAAERTAAVTLAAATRTPQQAVNAGASASAARGITSYVAVLDRNTGRVLARTGNAGTQVASESVVKLLIAAYYRVHYGSSMSPTMDARLTQMIRCSDDGIASSYWTNSIVPEMAARYGLSHTANNPGNPGYWGRTRITADDMAKLLYRFGKDSLVGPWVMRAMTQATDRGCDGFNQNFGFNAIAGAGSKQGWGADNWTGQPNAVHSVGFTSRYMVAVLQTGNPGTYGLMPASATYTARLIAGSSASRYPTYSKTQADRFTSALYRQMLARTISSPAQSVSLQTGTRSKEQVATELSTTTARRIQLTHLVYRDCLGRNADAAGLRVWPTRLATWNVKDLYIAVCSSAEAFTKSGSTNSGWAARAIKGTWRVTPTAAQIRQWAAVAATKGRAAAVEALTGAEQFRRQWIDRLNLSMRGRHATSADYSWTKDLMRGRGIFSLSVKIAVSAEYWRRWVG